MNVIFPRSPEIESRAADWFRALPGVYFINPTGIYFIAIADLILRRHRRKQQNDAIALGVSR